MLCMKCGRKKEDGQSFCPECLAVMEKYPVASATLVQLPKRPQAITVKKSSRRKTRTPEEQVQRLKTALRFLVVTVLLLCIALAGAIWLHFDYISHKTDDGDSNIGQNYTVDTTISTTGDNVSRETSEPDTTND